MSHGMATRGGIGRRLGGQRTESRLEWLWISSVASAPCDRRSVVVWPFAPCFVCLLRFVYHTYPLCMDDTRACSKPGFSPRGAFSAIARVGSRLDRRYGIQLAHSGCISRETGRAIEGYWPGFASCSWAGPEAGSTASRPGEARTPTSRSTPPRWWSRPVRRWRARAVPKARALIPSSTARTAAGSGDALHRADGPCEDDGAVQQFIPRAHRKT